MALAPATAAGRSPATRLKRVAWFYCELMQSGGGERLSLEGARRFEAAGIETHYLVYTPYDKAAAFEGRYEPRVVSKGDRRSGLLATLSQVAWLRRRLLELEPDVVVTEGTWIQVVHVYLATLFTGIPYAAMVAGSLFAYPAEHERSKYAWIFRKRLLEIRDSVWGYRQTTPAAAPRLGPAKRLYNEAFSLLKYLAVRGARRLFTHSRQNSWEVERLYGRSSRPLKGAFPESIFSRAPGEDARGRLGLAGRSPAAPGPEGPGESFRMPGLAGATGSPDLAGRTVVLTVSRHSSNKRLDLTLRAFAELQKTAPGAVLLVGGKSYEQDRFHVPEGGLAGLARELGVERDVHFLGYVPESRLWDTLASCDVFVHMDLADFDIAPYEALALGRKVVWSSEMELDAELAAEGRVWAALPSVEDVARAMKAALAAPAPASGDAAKKVLSRYTWESFFAAMLADLAAAVEPKP